MKTILVLAVSVGLMGIGGCAADMYGKGKGKAPPPVASPIVTKG
ncbi:ABC transporter [Bosea sp. 2KB_26]|nr:ABC transporter [Bosea sp. BIWAKO-01]GAU86571.1 hypothetical protein BIWAKO_06519 [Bosea sp. BIWAKO-01]